MGGGRRDQEDDRDRGAQERGVVDIDLVIGQLAEALLEREDEEEGKEHLCPRHGEPVLLDELTPFLVELLLAASLVVRHAPGIPGGRAAHV